MYIYLNILEGVDDVDDVDDGATVVGAAVVGGVGCKT